MRYCLLLLLCLTAQNAVAQTDTMCSTDRVTSATKPATIPDGFQVTGKAPAQASRRAYMTYMSSEASEQYSQNLKDDGYIAKSPGWAGLLGWIPLPKLCNECGGYFFEPASIRNIPNPPAIADAPLNITNSGLSLLSANDTSSAEGNVVITQPGRQLNADKVTLLRDAKSGEINQADLQGHVRMQQAGQLLVGDSSHIDLVKKTIQVKNGAYHITQPAPTGTREVWGSAKEMTHSTAGITVLKNASYTTCAPTDPSWHLKAKEVNLNKQTGRGTATDAWLYAGEVPVFYTPYFGFPIDASRYSGFLYPAMGYSSQSGALLSVPYYLNLAPNYDDTVTLTGMSRRGVLFDNLFRYLTPKHQGALELGFLPNDREFSNFQQITAQNYPANSTNQPYLNALNSASNNRASVAFSNLSRFNNHWSSALNLNYVTDDYYFQDLTTGVAAVGTDQLLNQADLSYGNEHWQFLTRLQGYQTLHPINQAPIANQYQRLPELDLSAIYPEQAYGLDYTLSSQLVNFAHAPDFFTGQPYPTGTRLHFNPQVSQPYETNGAFLTPGLALDITNYNLANNASTNTQIAEPTILTNASSSLNVTRALPVLTLDSGLLFERSMQLGEHTYNQTLEPRLFYLFVPTSNQNNIPIFDTTRPPFNFDELFRSNRFVGYDRIGDANQLSAGITSRFLNGFTGEDQLDASVGQIYYLHRHSVCLYPNCSDDPTIGDAVSPIAGQLFYHINPHLGIIDNSAWDAVRQQWNNNSFGLQYQEDSSRSASISYDYIRNGDPLIGNTDNSENNLHRINITASWPLTEHWHALGDWNYNISHNHPQQYLYGLEYSTCCWAVRVVASDTLLTEDGYGNTSFNKAYYFQVLFKGLGAVGNTGVDSLISNAIPNYNDSFTGNSLL